MLRSRLAGLACAAVLLLAVPCATDLAAEHDHGEPNAAPPAAAAKAIPLHPMISHHERLSLDVQGLEHEVDAGRRRRAVGGPEGGMRMDFEAFGKQFSLELTRTQRPFSRNVVATAYGEEGAEPVHIDMSRFYRGRVLGRPRGSTFVRLTVRQGGYIDASIELDGETYLVEPAHNYNSSGAPAWSLLEGRQSNHVIYRRSDFHGDSTGAAAKSPGPNHDHQACGTDRFSRYVSSDTLPDAKLSHILHRSRRAAVPFSNTSRTCELHLVSDHRFFADVGSSATFVTDELITFVEELNRIYKNTAFTGSFTSEADIVNINFAVRKISIFTSASAVVDGNPNPFSDTTDSATFLGQLGTIDLDDVCLGHGFTTQAFNGNVLGLAFLPNPRTPSGLISGICSKRSGASNRNCGITTTFVDVGTKSPALQTRLVLTHEIGHNFGMSHDTECDDFCSEQPAKCQGDGQTILADAAGDHVMFPFAVDGSQANNNVFSDCSAFDAGMQIRRIGGCFSSIGDGPICGNGIVEGNEECDCGSTTTSICNTNDNCCNTNCTVKAGLDCSPLAGDCCDETCSFTGIDHIDNSTAGETACRAATDCTLAGFCVKDARFKGKCPDPDFPHHEAVEPPGCDIFNSSQTCERVLPENPSEPYLYHKADGTFCNFEANTCQFNGCTGSICSVFNHSLDGGQFTPTECILADPDHQCELACVWRNNSACQSSYEFALTADGITLIGLGHTNLRGYNRAPGKSCNSFAGFCDQAGQCQGVSDDSPLDILLALDVVSFVRDNWYIVAACEVLLVLFVFVLRLTYRKRSHLKERLKTVKPASKKKRRARREHHKRAGTVARARQSISEKKAQELKYKKLKKDHMRSELKRFGIRRAELLFPTAEVNVLMTVMASSPHEEALVLRMLHLGYPMDISVPTLITLDPVDQKQQKREDRKQRRAQAQARLQNQSRAQQRPQPQAMPLGLARSAEQRSPPPAAAGPYYSEPGDATQQPRPYSSPTPAYTPMAPHGQSPGNRLSSQLNPPPGQFRS